MTRIRCRDRRCIFNKNGICSTEEIEYEPDAGCLTMELREDIEEEEAEWDDEEEIELAEEEEEEEDDDWDEEEENY